MYNPESIESFATSYAYHKKELIVNFIFYQKNVINSKELRYQLKTEKVFKIILQKKLFNLQCLWRAEQVEIPEIKLAAHFSFWEKKNIEDCPFLEPVSQQELEFMKLFLECDNYTDSTCHWICSWQDYDEIMEQNEQEDYECMPEWYQFYDLQMGTSFYLNLPNIRGKKEEYYFSKNREKYGKEQEGVPIQPLCEYKSTLWGNTEYYNQFITLFEDQYIQYLQKGYVNFYERGKYGTSCEELEEIEEAIQLLAESDQPVIMPGGLNWKEAILKCAQQYINRIIADELNFIWENKQMLYDMGFRKHFMMDELYNEYENHGVIKILSDCILDGREFAGEPRNLDF